jgi:hypothetical protein
MTMQNANMQKVNDAFSAQAPLFDGIQRSNPMLEWMRSMVHRHMEEFIAPGQSLADINAGTGIDALHFAQRGLTVHAMDIADGMVNEVRKKIDVHGLSGTVTAERRSFTEAGGAAPRMFDHIFSNFGGLNCIPDLRPVAEQLRMIIRPGSLVTMVIMPKVCPWEVLHLLRGNTEIGLRRLRKDGVIAHIEGHYFRTYYHSVGQVQDAFGEDFRTLRLRGVASCSPPPYMEKVPARFPGLYRFLQQCDERLTLLPPFNQWADQFILTMRYEPKR